MKLSVEQPDAAPKAAADYRDALGALGGPPGGAVRLVQASERAVTMQEDFDRPLVLGYLGFDVRVFPDGTIGAPVRAATNAGPSKSWCTVGPDRRVPSGNMTSGSPRSSTAWQARSASRSAVPRTTGNPPSVDKNHATGFLRHNESLPMKRRRRRVTTP